MVWFKSVWGEFFSREFFSGKFISNNFFSINPGASTTRQARPASTMLALTKSRVVPAMGEVTAAVRPRSAFKSVLLPAFGAPAITTVGGSIKRHRRLLLGASAGVGAPFFFQRSGCASSSAMASALAARASV